MLFAVESRVFYSTNELLSVANKDVLPALQKSNAIYQFLCHCGSQYVGRTSKKLVDRIKQHVHKSICFCSSSQKRILTVSANLPPSLISSLLLLIQPLDFILYKILPALNIMTTVDLLFLPKAAICSIHQLLNPLSSKFLTQSSADKKNSCTAQRLSTNDALSLVFFRPITVRLFSINGRSFSLAFHSDNTAGQVPDEKFFHCNTEYIFGVFAVTYTSRTEKLTTECWSLVMELELTSASQLLPSPAV